jgi:hypothetical protein
MLMFISLLRLEPQISFEEYEKFERSVIQRYTEYYMLQGVSYLGLFYPHGLQAYNLAKIHLVNAVSLEEGQRKVITSPNAPEEIQAIESICRSLHMPGARMNIWLKPIEISPYGRQQLILKDHLLRFYFYVPNVMKSLEDFRQFECRTQTAYGEFMQKIDWYYMGAYQADGLLERMYAGFDLVRADSPQEAMRRDEAYPVTPEIKTILAESQSFRQPGRELITLWLEPTILSPFTEKGICLSEDPGHTSA